MPFIKEFDIVSEHILTKDKASAFSNPDLFELLKSRNINHVEIVEIDGNCCIKATAADAVDLGLTVTLPLPLVGTSNADRFNGTRERLENAGILFIE